MHHDGISRGGVVMWLCVNHCQLWVSVAWALCLALPFAGAGFSCAFCAGGAEEEEEEEEEREKGRSG